MISSPVTHLENQINRLPAPVGEFLWFGLKQAWACLFGALLLLGILATSVYYPDIPLTRYDFLVIYAVGIQLALFALKLESWREICVIFLFHLMATGMELFKTSESIGSWAYPESSFFRIGNVPLFTGFMYSAVGSYMARAWRGFHFRFTGFPPLWIAGIIAVLAYANFFTHHYIPDIRWPLIIGGAIAFWKTVIHFKPKKMELKMPLIFGFCLVAFFIWIAENVGTLARAWQYPNQKAGWEMVSISKFTAWYLLMQLSFILIYSLRQLEGRLGVKGPEKVIPGKSV
ncbi:DUF817 domain-containing protein [Luteolibacter sp. AS25]|uniref:DUF817 domain-containing protein n=1 Tax=Luteolibacter sp. AS25 TaxID=3135776 RepID=UPI00398A9ACF